MKTVFEHVEHVKGKPHHIRKRVAFAAAASGAALIAIVWLVGNVYMGVFALQETSFADATAQQPVITTSSPASESSLAGAAAAFQGANTPARIEIVDTSTPPAPKAEQTTIPF